jgi:tetratricopeptide (TPR) repeat protein
MLRLAAIALLMLMGAGIAVVAAADLAKVPDTATAQLDPQVRAVLDAARERFQTIGDSSPDQATLAQAYADWADHLHAHQQIASARVAYQNALQLLPDNFDWRYGLTLLELGAGADEAALGQLNQALLLNPQYPAAWIRRGDLHLNRGELAAAGADYQQALKLAPDSAAAHAGLGQLASQNGDPAEAARQLEIALAAQPQATRLRSALALAYRSLGQIDQAREQLASRGDQPVRIDDPVFERIAALARNAVAYFEQARAMANAGRGSEALALLAKAVELAPEDSSYLRAYGEQLIELGRGAEARTALQNAWNIAPDNATIAQLLARLDQADGQPSAAVERYGSALKLDPERDDIRVELAHLAMRMQQYALAAEHFGTLSTGTDPKARSYALYWLGLANAQLARCAAADQPLYEVLELSKGRDGWAMLALARVRAICADTGAEALQQAVGWAELLHRQHAGPETAETLAMIRAAQGRFAEAQQLQSEAIAHARAASYSAELIEWMQAALTRFSQSRRAEQAFAPDSPLLRES